MRNRVVITGIGTVNPLGLDVESTWHQVVQGKSAVERISLFNPTDHSTQIAAEVKNFDADARFGRRDARRVAADRSRTSRPWRAACRQGSAGWRDAGDDGIEHGHGGQDARRHDAANAALRSGAGRWAVSR